MVQQQISSKTCLRSNLVDERPKPLSCCNPNDVTWNFKDENESDYMK